MLTRLDRAASTSQYYLGIGLKAVQTYTGKLVELPWTAMCTWCNVSAPMHFSLIRNRRVVTSETAQ